MTKNTTTENEHAENKTAVTKLCSQPAPILQILDSGVGTERASFILTNSKKWINGTELTYYFMDGDESQKNVVREAFKTWKRIGIGITFKEIFNVGESILRIGFVNNDGSWSYVGRDNLSIRKTERTMNFGWDLTNNYGVTTALHEIGHAIGFQHEHQSPFSGIEWNTEAVYKEFSGKPNYWKKEVIDHNILNKLSPNDLIGSKWDADSIMEYEFGPGLINNPVQYKNGIFPRGVLSLNDIEGVKRIYPPITKNSQATLELFKFEPVLVNNGAQADFIFDAPVTAKYTFQTIGKMDTVMVVNELDEDAQYYMSGSDDSGTSKNSNLTLPLIKGRKYLVNIRVMYSESNNGGVIVTY